MKNNFALCFRPVDDIEKDDEKDGDRDHIRSRRSFSFNDINQIHTDPSSVHVLPRRNSSSRKNLSRALKTLFRSTSPKGKQKGIGAQEGDHIGIEKNKGKEANNSCSSSSSTSHVTSPSSSTSSSMNSLETSNINEVLLKRSNSTSIYQNKRPKTNKGLKSSPKNQEGFVFYLVILVLVFNLLFGFVYAIMMTSLSLYFIGRHCQRERPVNALKLAELRKYSRRKTMVHGV